MATSSFVHDGYSDHKKAQHAMNLGRQTGYNPVEWRDEHHLRLLRQDDDRLKRRIRILRLVLRIITFIITILVFIPITMTLYKFLTTKDEKRFVVVSDGTRLERGPWSLHTKAWPTYMYFAIALVSLIFNGAVVIAYARSIRAANKVDTIASSWSWAVLAGHVIMWTVGIILYKKEKKINDLWGWSCSKAAAKIQEEFLDEVNFSQYCSVQAYSWYAGLIQVGAAILSAFILFLVYRRYDTRKTIKKRETLMSDYQNSQA